MLSELSARRRGPPSWSARTASRAAERDGVRAHIPKPSEGEPIPAAHEGGVTTPDGSIYTVWTSPTEHHLVFLHPGGEARYNALHRRMNELLANLPDRVESRRLLTASTSSHVVLPADVLARARAGRPASAGREALALGVPTVAGLIVIVLSALGLPAEPHYSVPVAPAFVLLAAGALLAPRGSCRLFGRRELARRLADARPWPDRCGLVAAAWAVADYVSKIHGAFDTTGRRMISRSSCALRGR